MNARVTPPQQGAPMGMRGGAPWEGAAPNGQPYVASSFFVYENDIPVTLAAGTATSIPFNIAGDSDFFWTKFCAFALVDGLATTREDDELPAVTLLITNVKTGRQYSNNPVPLPNMAGTAVFPFILPMVVLWEAFSTIQCALSNEGDTDYSNLQLSFIGVKAFTNVTTQP